MSVACTSDGRVLFGSNDGVVTLAPMFAKGLNYAAPLRIHSEMMFVGKVFLSVACLIHSMYSFIVMFY